MGRGCCSARPDSRARARHLAAGGVDDLDALKRRLALQGRGEDLQSQADEAERQLEAMFGVRAEETAQRSKSATRSPGAIRLRTLPHKLAPLERG